ncbi:MAG TPA: hypothetical protein VJ831_10560, partial [Jatrophihabitantaceae bacterium]|nr:hypothetical protein [Jatrophihabitantaceae bacterium]
GSAFALAGWIDVRAFRRRRRIRSGNEIWLERLDLHRDLESTQHRGLAIPIGDICRDRQRSR